MGGQTILDLPSSGYLCTVPVVLSCLQIIYFGIQTNVAINMKYYLALAYLNAQLFQFLVCFSFFFLSHFSIFLHFLVLFRHFFFLLFPTFFFPFYSSFFFLPFLLRCFLSFFCCLRCFHYCCPFYHLSFISLFILFLLFFRL